MMTLKTLFFAVSLLIKCSGGTPNDSGNETPSKVAVNEYFNNPIIPAPVSPFGSASLGSNYVHQGTNFFFNPQIHLGTRVSPPSKAIIAAVKPISEVPPCIEETKVPVVPEIIVPPALPPTPVEVPIEEPIAIPIPPPPFIAVEVPKLPEPVLFKQIPDAPILPPLEPPTFPVLIEETVEIKPPSPPEVAIAEVIPVQFIMPESPVLPPLVLPQRPPVVFTVAEKEPCPPTENTVAELLPLPEFTPQHEEESEVSIDEDDVYTQQEIIRFNEIPTAPELPPLVMPDIPKPIPVGELKKVVLIPPTPAIATIVAPKEPVEVVVETVKEFPQPTICARNIVLERVLPNIVVSKKTITKSVEIISIPAATTYPVLTAPFVPTFMMKN